MKNGRIVVAVALALVNVGLCIVAAGQEKATAREVVAKVRDAASALAKTGDVEQFKQKDGPWVWKDTYVFVEDCDKKVIAANPVYPDLVGKDLTTVKDVKSGKEIYANPETWCKKVKSSASGVWNEYWWRKNGAAAEPSRKLSYHLSAKGTPYVVSAGIYDDKATLAEVSKISSKK